MKKNGKRGSTPDFIAQDKLKPLDRLGSPTQHRQRELTRLKNQLVDLKTKTRNIAAKWKERFCHPPDTQGRDEESAEESEWRDESLPQNAEHILTWSKLEKRTEILLGKDNLHHIIAGEFAIPPAAALNDLAEACAEEATTIANDNVKRMKSKPDKSAEWDWAKNYGRNV